MCEWCERGNDYMLDSKEELAKNFTPTVMPEHPLEQEWEDDIKAIGEEAHWRLSYMLLAEDLLSTRDFLSGLLSELDTLIEKRAVRNVFKKARRDQTKS